MLRTGTAQLWTRLEWPDPTPGMGGYGYMGAYRKYTYELTDELADFVNGAHSANVAAHEARHRANLREGAGHAGAGWLGNRMAAIGRRLSDECSELARRAASAEYVEVRYVGSREEALAEKARIEVLPPLAVQLGMPDEVRDEGRVWIWQH